MKRRLLRISIVNVLGAALSYHFATVHPSRYVPPVGRQDEALLAAAFWPAYWPCRILRDLWIPFPAGYDTIDYSKQ